MNIKAYKCTLCKRRFRENGDLTRHMKTHSNDRPFECKICYSKFKRSDNMKQHIRLQH